MGHQPTQELFLCYTVSQKPPNLLLAPLTTHNTFFDLSLPAPCDERGHASSFPPCIHKCRGIGDASPATHAARRGHIERLVHNVKSWNGQDLLLLLRLHEASLLHTNPQGQRKKQKHKNKKKK